LRSSGAADGGATGGAVAPFGAAGGAGADAADAAAAGLGGSVGAATALAGATVAGALGTTARGAGAGGAGRTGSIAGGDGAGAARASGASPAAGATSASCGISAGAPATGIDAAGGVAGTGPVVGTCLDPAQPAARKQVSTSTMHPGPCVAARSIISASGSATKVRTGAHRIAPRGSLMNRGALKIQSLSGRESVRLAFYENHESSAFFSQAESCFSASSLAMP